MSKEIRRVPHNWKHPKDDNDQYIPLYDGAKYKTHLEEWTKKLLEWSQCKVLCETWEAFSKINIPPAKADYTDVDEDMCSQYQIYETVSKGTPVSPVFRSLEQVCEYLLTGKEPEEEIIYDRFRKY